MITLQTDRARRRAFVPQTDKNERNSVGFGFGLGLGGCNDLIYFWLGGRGGKGELRLIDHMYRARTQRVGGALSISFFFSSDTKARKARKNGGVLFVDFTILFFFIYHIVHVPYIFPFLTFSQVAKTCHACIRIWDWVFLLRKHFFLLFLDRWLVRVSEFCQTLEIIIIWVTYCSVCLLEEQNRTEQNRPRLRHIIILQMRM